jgi:hypothetical protein
MATLIHLCRKDYSFAKQALWSAWAVFILAALLPSFISAKLSDAAAPMFGLFIAASIFMAFSAALRILRADSFTGGNTFIGTRPVTMTSLWLSKLTAIAAFVCLPWLLAQVIGVLALRVHLTPADWMLFLAEKTLLFGLPASIALIVGAHTRHFVWSIMLTLTLGALILVLFAVIFGKPVEWNPNEAVRHLKASQWLVAQILISIAAILLSWLWMAQRRVSWSIAAGLIVLAAIALVSTRWKVNFVERLVFSNAPKANELRIAWHGEPSIGFGSRNGVPFTMVMHEAKVDGVPEGWISNFSDVRSHARLRDGEIITSHVSNSRNYGAFSHALLPSFGVEQHLTSTSRHYFESRATWFDAKTSLLSGRKDQTAKISGVCMIELAQPLLLANLPARPGASTSQGRFRYHIEDLDTSSGVITLKLVVGGINLASRGDFRKMQDDIEILLINPKTGKHTTIGRGTGSSSAGLGWITMTRSLSIDDGLPGPGQQTSDPQTFLKDAQLYLIGSRYGSTVRVPFEMPDLKLSKAR